MKKAFVLPVALFTLAALSLLAWSQPAPGYKVSKTWKLGGEGGWDYHTVDAEGHRLFIAPSTRVRGVDNDTGKLLTEVSDQPGLHVVARAPEFGRGLIRDGGDKRWT